MGVGGTPSKNVLMLVTAVAALAAVGAGLALLVGVSLPRPATVAAGLINHQGRLVERGDAYAYGVYVPPRRAPGRAMPLVVVLHGCGMTPGEMAAASGYSRLASQDGFMVLYPDVDAADASFGACWKGLWDPQSESRGRGDAGALAAMTRRVLVRWKGDPGQVYAIGISAGGFEAAILGADYPDLYAAIGIHSGAPYGGGGPGCATESPVPGLPSVSGLAHAARRAMGARARVMPLIVFHGSRDGKIPYACGRQAVAQWLETDALVGGHGRRTMPVVAAMSVTSGRVSRGRAYSVVTYSDRSSCTLAQFWTVDGMGHFWSGGSAAPASLRFSDPRGPSASRASWAFFRNWRLSGPVRPCRRALP